MFFTMYAFASMGLRLDSSNIKYSVTQKMLVDSITIFRHWFCFSHVFRLVMSVWLFWNFLVCFSCVCPSSIVASSNFFVDVNTAKFFVHVFSPI